jgi:integrase
MRCECLTTIGKQCVREGTILRRHDDGNEYCICKRHDDRHFKPFPGTGRPFQEETKEHAIDRNRPQKGDTIKVEPIRSQKDIATIKKLLADKPRDLAIFTLGINTNLRASDILKVTIGQVRHLQPGEHFTIREKKTGKDRTITINKTVYDAVQPLLKLLHNAQDDEPLFQSRKGGKAMCVPYLNSLVKSWCKQINLKGNYGSHTLRKTFGYLHRTVVGTDIPTLMKMFNHSTQAQTLAYLGIQEEEVQDAYMKGEF